MPTFEPSEQVKGVVTARKCDCCGHHEIGIVTAEGAYVPLKPGMRVAVISATDAPTVSAASTERE